MMRSGEAAATAAAQADSVYRALAKHAVADVRHRPQDPKLAGRREPMVLNGAFLVRRADTHTFRAAAAELAGHDLGKRSCSPARGRPIRSRGGGMTAVERLELPAQQASLVDLLDRLLGVGVVLSGDVTSASPASIL